MERLQASVVKPGIDVLAFKACCFGLLLCSLMSGSHAGTSAGQLSVNITLTGTDTGTALGTGVNTAAFSAPGVCISQTLSEKTNAVVRVVCGTGQFVSMTANPNVRFLGVNGGAYRYVLSPGITSPGPQSGSLGLSNDFYPGTGTVTAWRIYNVDGSDGPLEVLLTF
jgi:hypothetical protein